MAALLLLFITVLQCDVHMLKITNFMHIYNYNIVCCFTDTTLSLYEFTFLNPPEEGFNMQFLICIPCNFFLHPIF